MTSVSFIGDELEESENVSDVMSPTRSTPHRLEPVGTNDPEYSQSARYLQRSGDGQEGDSMTTGMTTGQSLNISATLAHNQDDSSMLSQHTLDELAQNMSADALAVAMSELSADDEATDGESFRPLLGHSTGDGENRDEDLSQYTNQNNSNSPPTQYPLVDTPEQGSLTQYSLTTPSPSQYPNSSLMDKTSGRGSLTQYPISEDDTTNTTESRSKSDRSDLAMFQTRPGTVIERPETDGHNDQDDVSPVVTKAPTLASAAKPAPDVSLKSMYDMSKSTFDSSIRVGHFTHSTSIGGDSMFADKTPLTSSTPNWIKSLEKGDASGTGDHFQPLQEDLMESLGPKHESPDANWSLNKQPAKDYAPENDRSRLGTSQSEHKPDDASKISRAETTMKTRSMEFSALSASEDVSTTKSDTQAESFTEGAAGEKSVRSSVRSAASMDNYDVTGSIDTSVWSGSRTSMERDGEFEEQNVSSSKPVRSPTSEGLDIMRGPSPKEVLQRIAAHSPVLSTPGLSLARENASLDLYEKKGPGSTSSGSSGETQQRSGTDSLLHYDGRDRLSHASDDAEENQSVGSGKSSKSSSSNSRNSQTRPQTVGRGSNEFQPLVPVDSTFEVSALSRESLDSIGKASRTSSSNVSSYHTVPSTVSAAEKFNLTSSSKSDSVGSHSAGEKLQPARSESTLQNSVHSTPSTSKDTITESSPERPKPEELALPLISSITNDETEMAMATATTSAQQHPPAVHDLLQPDSARSSQDSKRSSLSIGATAETLNRRGSLSERVAQILADRSSPAVSTPSKQGDSDSASGGQGGEVVVDDVDAKSEVDSDVERITGEYKAILQGVSAKLASGEQTDNIQKMADEALKSVSQSEIVIETTTTTSTEFTAPTKPTQTGKTTEEVQKKPTKTITYKYIAPPPMTMVEPSSGSDTEDQLDRDVRQILAKYGRRLSSDEESTKPRPEFQPQSQDIAESRSSPAGSAYSTDDSLAKRVGQLMLKSTDFGSTVSPNITTNLPGYLYDDPSRSMTLPMDLVSSNSSASEEATDAGVAPERTQAPEPSEVVSASGQASVPRANEVVIQYPRKISQATKEDSSSVDTLHKKVSEILESSGHLVSSDSSHYSSSRSPSRASSVDYKLLHQDMIELENNLESIKATERRHYQRQPKPQEEPQEIIVTPAPSTIASEYSTPKKYAWDHSGDIAANDTGRFVSTHDLPKPQSKKPSPTKTYYSSMPLNPLLTDGSVPIEVALDLIHGPEHAPYRHHTEYGSFHDSKDVSGLEAAQHSPARRQIKFDDAPDQQNRSGHTSGHQRSTRDEPDFDRDVDDKYYSLPDSLHRELNVSHQKRDTLQNRSSLSDESYTATNKSRNGGNQTLESHNLSRTMEDLTTPQLYDEPKADVRRSAENLQEYSLTKSADEEVSSIHEMSERQQEMQDRSQIAEARRVWENSRKGDRELGCDQRRDVDPKPVDSYTKPNHRSQVTRPLEYSKDHSSYFPQSGRTDRTRTSDASRTVPPNSSYFPKETPAIQTDISRGFETRNRDVLKPTGGRNYEHAISSSTPKNDLDHSPSKANITPKTTTNQTPQDRSIPTKADSSYKEHDSLVSSPVKHKPFTVFGQMQNLFASQRDKASAAQFDESVELRSPLRQNFVEPSAGNRYPAESPQTTTDLPPSTERLTTEQLIEKYTKKLHELERKDNAEAQRQRDQRIREELEAKLSGLSDSESSTYKQSEDELTAPPRSRLSDPLRKSEEFAVGIKDRSKNTSTDSTGLKTTSPNLRPYRPAGSSELYYYVDPSAADQDCNHSVVTVETVESTHTGSDDARAPVLPQHAYGSSPNPPANVVGVYSKTQLTTTQASLKPIQEQSFDSHDTEQARLSSSSSKPTSTHSRKSQKSEEQERSFSKARDWLNGTYPSKEDLTAPDQSHDQKQPITASGRLDRSEKEVAGSKTTRSKDNGVSYRKEGRGYGADSRDRFETPKKVAVSQSDDTLTRSSKARLNEYVAWQKLSENDIPASRRGYTKERDHSHDMDPPPESKPSKSKSKPSHDRSPVDLHQLPASYDIRNDRYDPTAMFRAQRSPVRRSAPDVRSKSPKGVPAAPSKSLPTKKATSGRSTPSSPSRSPCRSPERMDDLDTITSFDKFYAKLDRYSEPDGEQRYQPPKSPLLRPRSLETFSPLQPEMDEHDDLGPTSPSRRPRSVSPPYNDTANTDILMQHADSFVSSLPGRQRPRSPGYTQSATQLSTSSQRYKDGREVSPSRYASDTRFDRRGADGGSPTRGYDHHRRAYGDHSYAPSTISPYSTATDRFQNSQVDESPSPARNRHRFASPDWRETRSSQVGSRSYPAEQLSPGVPDNAQELWEKFQKIQNSSGSEPSLDLTKIARLVEEQQLRGQSSGVNDRSKVEQHGKEEKIRETKTVRINERANQTRETEEEPRDRYRPKEDRETMEKWGPEVDAEKRERLWQREALQREAQEKLKRNEEEGEKLRLELEQVKEKRRLQEQQREEERQRLQREREEKLRQEEEILRLQKEREERYRQEKEREERRKMERELEERKRLDKEREERHKQEKEREERYRKQKEIEERYRQERGDAEKAREQAQNTTDAAELARTMDRDSAQAYREQLEKEREQRLREAAERRKQEQEEAIYKEQILEDEQNIHRLQEKSYDRESRSQEKRPQDLRERQGEMVSNGRLSFTTADKVRSAATSAEKSTSRGSYQENSQSENRREGEGSDREQRDRDDSRRRREQGGNGGGGRDPGSGGGHGGRDPGDGGRDDPDKDKDKQDTEEDQDKETDEVEKKPRKQAWVIRDETLLSIPEDNTINSVSSDFMTSSEIDSEGKQITRTTKRHLPADPKLLKLQQKIAKQKEKHRREWVREQKRKEKIKMLERVLVEQAGAAGLTKHRRHIVVMEESSTTFSSTLSSSGENSTLQNPSDDGTLTDGGEDRNGHNDTFTVDDTYQKTPKCSCHVSRETKKSPGRSQNKDTSPRKKRSPSPEKLNSFTVHHYSPKRQKTRTPEPSFQLKEVDYRNETNMSRTKDSRRADKENRSKERPATKATTKAATKTTKATTKATPKTSQTSLSQSIETRDFGATCPTPLAVSPTPEGRRSAAVQTSPLEAPNAHSTPGRRSRSVETSNQTSNQRSRIPERTHSRISHSDSKLMERSLRKSQERSHKRSQERTGERSQRSRSGHRLQSPSPSRHCPLHGKRNDSRNENRNENRNSNRIPSEHRHTSKSPGRSGRESRSENRSQNASVNRSMSPGMFTPEGSDEENRQPQKSPPRPKVKPAQAWFIPLEKETPKELSSRRPLGERQPSSDPRQAVHALLHMEGPDREPHVYRSSESLVEDKESTPHTLQDALLSLKPEFVSRLRERQRHVALRAEERKIQAMHKEERDRLFNVKRNRSDANLNAVPISEMHYRPMKRYFTHKEMKEHTERIYQSLPEVKQMQEDKKRNDFYKTNRLRAQLYKQPTPPFILRHCKPSVGVHKNPKSGTPQKRYKSASVNFPKYPTKPKKKIVRKPTTQAKKTNYAQPKLQPKRTDATKPNVQVTRHIGMVESGPKKEEKSEKQKKEERRKKKEECEMSLAAALARVGIAPNYGQSSGNQQKPRSKSKKPVAMLRADQTETYTEVKTLYKFNYQVK